MKANDAADPLHPIKTTLKGKLLQHKIVKTAAKSYLPYENQVEVTTSFVQKIYFEL